MVTILDFVFVGQKIIDVCFGERGLSPLYFHDFGDKAKGLHALFDFVPPKMTSKSNQKVSNVAFDVGGRIYKVSRSLLEANPTTMLCRISSETWQRDPNGTIFIERDNERFRYCLDYLRDGCVEIPMTVSKGALLKDLEYFGIEYNSDFVQREGGEERLPSFVSTLHVNVKRHKYQLLALACFVWFSRHRKLRFPLGELSVGIIGPWSSPIASLAFTEITGIVTKRNLLDKKIAIYGLKFWG